MFSKNRILKNIQIFYICLEIQKMLRICKENSEISNLFGDHKIIWDLEKFWTFQNLFVNFVKCWNLNFVWNFKLFKNFQRYQKLQNMFAFF